VNLAWRVRAASDADDATGDLVGSRPVAAARTVGTAVGTGSDADGRAGETHPDDSASSACHSNEHREQCRAASPPR
jgi:hypothetical protein